VDCDRDRRFSIGEIAQHRGNFIHALVEFLVGNDDRRFRLRFRNENEGGFVFVLRKVAVDAVVAGR